MAASATVSQLSQSRNLLIPRNGSVTLYGYGIRVFVDRGHLNVEDGIGPDRRKYRFARVRHGLRRLVVIGSDGMVSLEALRWLADQNAAFVMLDRDGSVLATTGPVYPSDARLRRAQALAHNSGVAMHIARQLVAHKLEGQERVARTNLNDSDTANAIAGFRSSIEHAQTPDALRVVESRAASAYWSAWRAVPVMYPTKDMNRVPAHWQTFGTRISPLTNSPRLAVNPTGAILNYLYAVLESEARLALAALGLDPGLGVMHFDTRTRDSLACDLMEPVRPEIDAYLLNWILREPLRKAWFFEQRDSTCRLMGSFAVRLSETAATWARFVAPLAEWVSHTLWSTIRKDSTQLGPATRLTGDRKRLAKGKASIAASAARLKAPRICNTCGGPVNPRHRQCFACASESNTASLARAAHIGRIAAHTPEAQGKRAETQRRNALAQHAWKSSDLPVWLNEATYRDKIQPRLGGVSVSILSSALRVSGVYAANIRAGKRVPHARHWLTLAQLVDMSPQY